MDNDIKSELTTAELLDYFLKLPPSHQQEYLEWIAKAKLKATRSRRIAEMVTMLKKKTSGSSYGSSSY